jgi:hypothetical protein
MNSRGASKSRPAKSAIVIRKGSRRLLAIVAWVDIAGVGEPGAHRYRYNVKPARIRNGSVETIEAFGFVRGIQHTDTEAYNPTIHTNLDAWKAK